MPSTGPFDKASLFIATDSDTGSSRYDDLIVHVGDSLEFRAATRGGDVPSE